MRLRSVFCFVIVASVAVGGRAQTPPAPNDPLAAVYRGYLNVKTFGCYGDDEHDDSQCFIAARDYAQTHVRADTTQASDGNRLGTIMLYVPAGTYLITQSEVMMSHLFRTRTVGYHLQGSGQGITLIDFRPTTPGALFFNNDSWLDVTVDNISFTSNNPNADFWVSYSAGGAQGCRFSSVSWNGVWANLFTLRGTNNNSEFDWDHVSIEGHMRTALYIPATGSSDQFLNYWFRNSKIWLSKSNFIEAHNGGHFKIDDCDFSGWTGSGSPNMPDIIFGLYGKSHARGVTHFECRNSRFELKTDSVRVLYSEWGSFGEVSFEDDDFGSQSHRYPPVDEFELNMVGAAGAPQYSFVRCQLMGFVQIDLANTDWGYRRNVVFQDVQFLSFDDYSLGVRFTNPLPSGSNYGSIPIVDCIRCRGNDINIASIEHWHAGVEYKVGSQVYSEGYVYRADMSGVSGTIPPSGRAGALHDGTVVWSSTDTYWGSDYAGDALLRPTQFATSGAVADRTVVVSSQTNRNGLPKATGKATKGFVRIILPPFAWVTRMQLVVIPGGCTQDSPGTYSVRTDSSSPYTFFSQTFYPLDKGGTKDGVFMSPFATGSDIGTRTVVLEADINVTEACSGWLVVWYL